MADLVFGTVSPAGRTPFTWHFTDFIDTNSFLDMSMRPGNPTPSGYSSLGRTYRFFTGDVIYPFGHGLSYTSFSVEPLTLLPLTRAGTGRLTQDALVGGKNRLSLPLCELPEVLAGRSLKADGVCLPYPSCTASKNCFVCYLH